MIKKRIIIKGKVHDVGYRLHLLQKAEELMIPNIWAVNIYENGIEIVKVLVGADKEKVDNFIDFLKESFPAGAIVDGTPTVEDYEGDIPTTEAFSRSFSTFQLSKIVQAGLGMLKKQDQTTIEIKAFRKESGEKQDQMLDKQDQTIEVLGGKIDNVSTKIDNLNENTGKRFDNLDVKYGRIAENMEKILKEMQEERKEFRKFTERIINTILLSKNKKS